MNDERNFRSLYYEKVGCKSVEEKRSLEMLFKDKTLDKNKISQFCSRFTVPFVYRSYVWKFLLGVIPAHKSCQEFVMKERTSQYHDLFRCLQTLNIVTDGSPKEQIVLQMWLLEKFNLMFDREAQLNQEFHQHLLAITRTLISVFESDVDVYWIAKGFYEYLKTWYSNIPFLIETTKSVLKREDTTLYSHLTEKNLLNKIPMDRWFGRCFAGVLHDTSLIRVWDKIIGGSYRVMIFVCSVLLTTMRRVLLTCANITDILSCVQSLTNETADVIVNKSLEMWQNHGRSVMPSPVKELRNSAAVHPTRKPLYHL
ncbi:TBC1 domain family member 7 [Macrosteles quadrilineatus]|uniref:TBC1 domain family member 7 n=1 Tax=Macrosteles quadrilineatus TaxID=74068 RepID=UPI0023E0CA28|nr:TBC1 domain family member 7 [Macrosteles quadrilineatus]